MGRAKGGAAFAAALFIVYKLAASAYCFTFSSDSRRIFRTVGFHAMNGGGVSVSAYWRNALKYFSFHTRVPIGSFGKYG